jgi:hypothetical protein
MPTPSKYLHLNEPFMNYTATYENAMDFVDNKVDDLRDVRGRLRMLWRVFCKFTPINSI